MGSWSPENLAEAVKEVHVPAERCVHHITGATSVTIDASGAVVKHYAHLYDGFLCQRGALAWEDSAYYDGAVTGCLQETHFINAERRHVSFTIRSDDVDSTFIAANQAVPSAFGPGEPLFLRFGARAPGGSDEFGVVAADGVRLFINGVPFVRDTPAPKPCQCTNCESYRDPPRKSFCYYACSGKEDLQCNCPDPCPLEANDWDLYWAGCLCTSPGIVTLRDKLTEDANAAK